MADEKKPNVVFILTDDQGPWAAGCCGNSEIRTPHIDRLAREGTRLENFFVATPVCSPSRATFLTGRISSQHGIHDWVKHGNVGEDAKEFLRDEVGYTDVLAENAYVCGLSGKWHMGMSEKPQHGMSFWYAHQKGGGPYYNAPVVRGGRLIEEPGYLTDVITDEALRFLRDHRSERFYLSVHYTAPHSPWKDNHPKEVVESYDDCPFESCPQGERHPWARGLTDRCLGNREELKGYFAAVTAMDANVGRILQWLDDAGLREETLVIFVSDNGFSCGHHGFWGKGNGTDPRNMYENSIKVPCIWSHVGSLPEGEVETAMVTAYDFLPTLLDYLGLPLPEGRPAASLAEPKLPGKSFLPFMRGDRSRENEFVVVYDEYGPVRMIRTEEWKYTHRYPDGPHDLYHLSEDPEERTNLAKDPAHAERARELKGEMEEWFAKYVVPEKDGLKEPPREKP